MRPRLPLLLLLVLPACAARWALAAEPGVELSAMTYNVLYDSQQTEASLALIAEAGPDLLCLREVTPGFRRAFEDKLAPRYPHRFFWPRSGTWGVALVSRYPLSHAGRFAEQPHRLPAAEATLWLGGRAIRVACLHLFPPVGRHRAGDGFLETWEKNAELRQAQARYLVERWQTWRGPLLVMGDMNESPGGAALATFAAAGLVRACDQAPRAACGNTWPADLPFVPPLVEIDHLLGRGLRFTAARVLPGGGSDHLAVGAVVTLAPAVPASHPPDSPAASRGTDSSP